MKSILFISFTLIVLQSFAQENCDGSFVKSYKQESGGAYYSDLAITNDGNIIFITLLALPAYNNGLLISKLNTNGDVIWSKAIDKYHDVSHFSIKTLNDKIFISFSYNGIPYNFETIILCLTNDGNLIWSKSISEEHIYQFNNNISIGNDYNIYINGDNFYKSYLVKLDTLGNLLENYSYIKNNYNYSHFEKVIDSQKNTTILGSGSIYSSSLYQTIITQLDSVGNNVWSYQYSLTEFTNIVEGKNNSKIICGSSGTHDNIIYMKINNIGEVVWAKKWVNNLEKGDLTFSIISYGENYIISGRVDGSEFNAVIDDDGNLFFCKKYSYGASTTIHKGKGYSSGIIFFDNRIEYAIAKTDCHLNIPCFTENYLPTVLDLEVKKTSHNIDFTPDTIKFSSINIPILNYDLKLDSILCFDPENINKLPCENEAKITITENINDFQYFLEGCCGEEYYWQPQYLFANNLKDTNSIFLNKGTEIILEVKDENGCVSFDTINLKYNFNIPNIITPNQDEFNEYFEIKGIIVDDLNIYNRWGKLVFHSNNYNNNWNAEDLPDGVYYFEINSKEKYKGWIQVIR